MTKTLNTRLLIKNDTTEGWESSTLVLLKGELALDNQTLKMKMGDGVHTWKELPNYFNDQTNTFQDNITTNGKNVGDVAVVTGENNVKTAYVWNGTQWAAMDGNYNADNIIFDEDITLAGDYTQVGNITKGKTEAKTLSAAGKSLSSVLASIFTKTLYPSAVTPAVSMTLTNAGSYEVGTSITPAFKVTFDPKTYTYGSTTNKTDGSTTGSAPDGAATITDSGNASVSVTMNGNSGTANGTAFTVIDNTSYYGSSVSLKYTAGYTPVNNLDQGPDEDSEGKATLENVQVKAGTATNGTDTSKITGFRYSFKYAGSTTGTIDDAWIRTNVRPTTANCVKNYVIGSIAVAEGSHRVMFAVPGTSKTLKTVIDVDGMGLDIKDKFIKTTVSVSGKTEGANTTTYTVWCYDDTSAAGFGKTTMTVTFN